MQESRPEMVAPPSRGDTERLTAAISARLREGRLPCAEAFRLAQEWEMMPLEVAEQTESQGVRLGWCQLGLFTGAVKGEKGWPAGTFEVPVEVQSAITAALEEGGLPCARAWGVAKRLGLERLEVGRAANAMGVWIVRCQLGCF
jgi:hypothetical protein